MGATLQVLALVAIPALTLLAARHLRPVAWVGPVVVCYAVGILLGNVPGLGLSAKLSLTVSEAAVPLALPLLLFSTDVPGWLRLARPTLLSFALACVAAVTSSALVGLWFSDATDEWWKMAGMLVGVYTGGTANMSAIGLALGVREETFIVLNAADVLASSAWLLLLLTVAQRVAHLFLPRFPYPTSWDEADAASGAHAVSRAHLARGLALSLLLAALIAGASAGVSLALVGRLEVALVLLLLSSLALGASFIPSVRRLPGSYALGDYVLLVFCVAIGTLADVRRLPEAGLVALSFCLGVVALAVVLHFTLAALLRIDADTVLITSAATIFGPPFIPMVARALRNRQLVVSGVTTGLVGYAVGTYLGLALAWLLRP